MSRLAVFAYGSLVSRASAAATLGRELAAPIPARMPGWVRRWTLVRDNLRAEKTFARTRDDSIPACCLSLSLEPEPGTPGVNGALIEVEAAELDRLDIREIRFRRVEVGEHVVLAGDRAEEPHGFDRVFAYLARAENRCVPPPADSILIASYLEAVEAAFEALGPGELERFRASTEPPPVEVVEAHLVRDEIPLGNPRAW